MGCFGLTFWLVVGVLIAWPFLFGQPEPSSGGDGSREPGSSAVNPAPSATIVSAAALQEFVRKDRDDLPAGSAITCPAMERTLGKDITCFVEADGEEWTVRVEMVQRADGAVGADTDPPERF